MNTSSTLGHYTIVQKLGSGGMGDVYVAEDTRLGRRVALKTLLPELAADAERRTRFEREARAVGALSHPNIVTLYSIESHGDVHFLTMELVSGRTLLKVIPRGGVPLQQFFGIAVPLADAVSSAHDHGITHRDLKPENIMVTDAGRVKVLDFGLAKLKRRPFENDDETRAISDARTGDGQVLGTVAYMSPEQAEGREVDHRSDIFSVGIILHQMLTGTRPFGGESTAGMLSALLRDAAPPVTDVRPDVPPRLARMIQRCLEKDPSRRYQSAADLHADLTDVQQTLVSDTTAPAAAARPARTPYAAGALLLVVAAAAIGGYSWSSRDNSPEGVGETEFTQLTHAAGQELFPALSPDGRTVVYASAATGNYDIYSQRVGGQNALNVTRDSSADDTQPAFSADGEKIAFRSERDGGGIFVAGATGESVRRVAAFGYHPAWSPDGSTLAVVTQSVTDPSMRFTSSELWLVTVASGERRRLGEADAAQPTWSPSGKRIAYWGRSGTTAAGDIWTIPAEGGTPVAVTTEPALDWNPVWAPDGRYLYFSSNRGGSMNIWRVAIDEASGRVVGRPHAVTTGGGASTQHLSISADGQRLAYVSRVESMNIQQVGFDRTTGQLRGTGQWITRSSRAYDQPSLSPDGRRLAFNSSGKQEDIFVSNIDGTGLQQITDDAHRDRAARWSPNGERIAFYSDRTGQNEIWTVRRDLSELRQVTRSPGAHYPVWSPDGRLMAYSTHSPNGAFIFDVTRPWNEQKPRALPSMRDPSLSFEVWGWSPNGLLLAGQKHLTDLSHAGIGIHEIGTNDIQWITDFGEWPVWLSDNKRLLFSHQGKLFLVDRTTRKFHEVLSLPQHALGSVSLSADERAIYYTVMAAESDVWLIVLK